MIPKKYGRWFRDLLFEREDADYTDYTTIDSSDAEASFLEASRFIEKVKELRETLILQI